MRARKSTREPPRDDLWNLRVGLRCELVCEGAKKMLPPGQLVPS
jgi:hypothetical protein